MKLLLDLFSQTESMTEPVIQNALTRPWESPVGPEVNKTKTKGRGSRMETLWKAEDGRQRQVREVGGRGCKSGENILSTHVKLSANKLIVCNSQKKPVMVLCAWSREWHF